MLKYKKHRFTSIADTIEDLTDILAGMSGKDRRIVSIVAQQTANLYIRVYRDAEQIVDIESDSLTSAAPFLPMDLPLAEGQLCKAGFLNSTGSPLTNLDITIGYTEVG